MIGTYAFAVQRNLIGQVVATLGGLVALVGTFLPWLRSGTRDRSSYEIFSLVDRLGISQSSVVGWGVRLWPVVPFLLVLAVTLQWFPRKWIGGTAVLIAVVYAGVVSNEVRSASSNSLDHDRNRSAGDAGRRRRPRCRRSRRHAPSSPAALARSATPAGFEDLAEDLRDGRS